MLYVNASSFFKKLALNTRIVNWQNKTPSAAKKQAIPFRFVIAW
jgi:hypothetical protein